MSTSPEHEVHETSNWACTRFARYFESQVHYTSKAHIQIGDSNSNSNLTQTRACKSEVMLEECLTEYCSSFKSVFKHVSQPLLTRVDSQVSITDGKNVILA